MDLCLNLLEKMKKKKFRNPFDKRNIFQQEKRNIFTFLKYKIYIRFTYVNTIGKFTKNIYLKVVKNATNISYNEIKCNDAKCKKSVVELTKVIHDART